MWYWVGLFLTSIPSSLHCSPLIHTVEGGISFLSWAAAVRNVSTALELGREPNLAGA